VGLGKTVQAGLILSELRDRGAIDRALVLTPAGLRDQWSSELHVRFGLDPVIVDAHEVRRRGAQLTVGVNPWTTFPLVVASMDFVKRPEVRPALESCRWDLIIVDEAHGVAPGSDRHASVNALCEAAPYVVLLTATPHSGDRAAFESLCRIGAVDGHSRAALLLFRRTRRDLTLTHDRRNHWLRVDPSTEELRLHEELSRFTSAVRAEHGDRVLALATLHKRALSSPQSLRLSVERRMSTLQGDRFDLALQLALPLDDGGGEFDPSDDVPAWTVPGLKDSAHERRLLEGLAATAREACRFESKLRTLVHLLTKLAARSEPAIVFTEYRDTLLHLEKELEGHPGLAGRTIAVLHGGLTRNERSRVVDAFQRGHCAILLATDAGGEGLNLHQVSRVVVNLELPWNPVRLEQRIGRVDRIGQRRRVHAFNLIASQVGECRILDRHRERLAQARQDLDVADPLGIEVDEDAAAFEAATSRHSDKAADFTGRDATPTRSASAGPTSPLALYEVPDLTTAASAEHGRLLWGRRLEAVDPRREGLEMFERPDPLLAFARRPSTRARLAGVLMMLESRSSDGSGRIVTSRIVPVVIGLTKAVNRGEVLSLASALVFWLEQSPTPLLADETSGVHRRFWDARLSREHAIAECQLRRDRAMFQPGLFEARLPRERDARTLREAEINQRLAMLARAGEHTAPRRRVVLIMIP
jgi:superfamily II DNA or RNA helicase